MAKFTTNGNLTLQDENGVWAEFVNGVFCTTDPEVIARLEVAEGVDQAEDDGPPPAPDAIEPDDLPTRTVPELRGYAAEYGINVDEAKTKAAIVHAIRTHFAALPDRQDEQA